MAGSSLSSFGLLLYPQPISDGSPPAGDRANEVVTGTFAAVGPGNDFPIVGPANFAIWAAFNTALTISTAGTNSGAVASAGAIAAGCAINSTLLPPGTTVKTIAGTAVTFAFPTLRLYGVLQSNGQITGLPWTAGLRGAAVSGPGIPAGATVASTPATNPGLNDGAVQLSNLATTPGAQGQPVAFSFALTANAISAGTDAAATFTGASIVWTGSVQLERSFNGGQDWVVCNVGGSGTMAQYSAGTPVSATLGEPEAGMIYRLNCTALTPAAGVAVNYRLSTTGAAASSLAINQLS